MVLGFGSLGFGSLMPGHAVSDSEILTVTCIVPRGGCLSSGNVFGETCF